MRTSPISAHLLPVASAQYMKSLSASPTTHSSTASTPKGYLSQIDIVRALAVFLVLLFHLFPTYFPTGYFGVDIFFVVSGFVITKSHFSNLNDPNSYGFVSSIRFFLRRFYRLFPALLIYSIPIALLASLLDDSVNVSGSMLSALLGFSNIYFVQQGQNYFSDDLLFNPFLQTWSLGVEQQFYLVVAAVIALGHFIPSSLRKSSLPLFFVAITFASFCLWLSDGTSNSEASYFLPQYRIWEIGIGMITFWFSQHIVSRSIRIPSQIAFLFYVLFFCAFIPDSYVVVARPIVCIFVSLLLVSIQLNQEIKLLWNHPLLLIVGQSSYSIYLWHWGFIVLFSLTLGASLLSSLAVIILSFAFGLLSFYFIESPLRSLPRSRSLLWQILVFLPSILISCSSTLLFQIDLFLGESRFAKSLRLNDLDGIPNTSISLANCFNFTDLNQAVDNCTSDYYGTTHRLWVLGDSHAFRLMHMAASIARRNQLSITLLSLGGTPFPPAGTHVVDDVMSQSKNMLVRTVETYVINNAKPGDVVLISNRLPYYFGPDSYENQSDKFNFFSVKTSHASDRPAVFADWIQRLEAFSAIMKDKGIKIIVVGPTPEWALATKRSCLGQSQDWFNSMRGTQCKYPVDKFVGANSVYNTIQTSLTSLADKRLLSYYDPIPSICAQSYCYYSVDAGGSRVPLYSDDDHLSVYSTRDLIRPSISQLVN
jgi:peptidoglycan/LPS O-acetylase OafA/YrhL